MDISSIRTVAKFESAHRQFGDKSKCGRLHGHNWSVHWIIDGQIGDLGYVADFKDIKSIIEPLDHVVLLNKEDPLCDVLKKAGQMVFKLPFNPTAENIASYIRTETINMIKTKYKGKSVSCRVRVYENDISYAQV